MHHRSVSAHLWMSLFCVISHRTVPVELLRQNLDDTVHDPQSLVLRDCTKTEAVRKLSNRVDHDNGGGFRKVIVGANKPIVPLQNEVTNDVMQKTGTTP